MKSVDNFLFFNLTAFNRTSMELKLSTFIAFAFIVNSDILLIEPVWN